MHAFAETNKNPWTVELIVKLPFEMLKCCDHFLINHSTSPFRSLLVSLIFSYYCCWCYCLNSSDCMSCDGEIAKALILWQWTCDASKTSISACNYLQWKLSLEKVLRWKCDVKATAAAAFTFHIYLDNNRKLHAN